jgi:hypothetical protein
LRSSARVEREHALDERRAGSALPSSVPEQLVDAILAARTVAHA